MKIQARAGLISEKEIKVQCGKAPVCPLLPPSFTGVGKNMLLIIINNTRINSYVLTTVNLLPTPVFFLNMHTSCGPGTGLGWGEGGIELSQIVL